MSKYLSACGVAHSTALFRLDGRYVRLFRYATLCTSLFLVSTARIHFDTGFVPIFHCSQLRPFRMSGVKATHGSPRIS